MNPEQAKVIAGFLLGDLKHEAATTERVLSAVPDDNLQYRPDNLSKTGIGLVRHIVLEDAWFLNAIVDGQFGPQPDDSDACGIARGADATARYRTAIDAVVARIEGMSGEQLVRELDFFGMFKAPAVTFLSLAIRHSTHHRGQLSAYLRAMGGKVPSIYGPTAETAVATA